MASTAVWAKVVWGSQPSRRTFLVRSIQGETIEEFEAEAEAYAFARGEDDQSLLDHFDIIEAELAPDETAGGEPFVMQAILPDGSEAFFGVDGEGERITSVSRDRAETTVQIRDPGPGPS